MVDVPLDPVTPSAPLRLPQVTPTGQDRSLDDATLTAAVAGDEAAFSQVFTSLHPQLRRYATVLVGPQADDVVGEAWLHIARDIRSFSGDVDGFRGWCVRIVRNRAVDVIRGEARRPADPTHDDRLDSTAPDDTAVDALDNIATAEAISRIGALPPDQAEAVMLRVVLGLDARTSGRILDKSAAAVRVAAHRGLRRLGRDLESTAREEGRS